MLYIPEPKATWSYAPRATKVAVSLQIQRMNLESSRTRLVSVDVLDARRGKWTDVRHDRKRNRGQKACDDACPDDTVSS